MKLSIANTGTVWLSASVVLLGIIALPEGSPAKAQRTSQNVTTDVSWSSRTSMHRAQGPGDGSGVGHGVKNIVPAGTILPVVLGTPISFQRCQVGMIVRGKIAQSVPLQNGLRIPKGSAIEGHVVQANPATGNDAANISIQFDKIYMRKEWVSIVTNLRAIAGFMDVMEAGVPSETPSEGTPYNWLPTTQIGGDAVYGVGGPVTSAENSSKVVGKSTGDGVLVAVSEKEGTKCRGVLSGNESLQALWVFSSDACGVYGIDHLAIAHAGRTDPRGTIVLASQKGNLELKTGDGLLLRVD
jgi:hypothetical protein